MKRTTVLLIGPLPPPEGGMTTSLRNIAESGLKDTYDLIVLDITGFRERCGGSLLRGLVYQIRLMFRLSKILITDKPKIVHIQMSSWVYFYRRSLDILICKLLGKKVIFHLRGAEFIDFYERGSFAGKVFKRFILGVSDRVIALSGKWRDFLSCLTRPDKIVIVPNGVICSEFARSDRLETPPAPGGGRIAVLFTGSIGKRKGVFDILAAATEVVKSHEDIIFIFAGPEEFDGEMARFRDMTEKSGIQGHIKYAGVVTGKEKTDLYLSSDIFILPSYAENLPNSVLEAMAAELPVIVSDVGALPEVIEPGVNGFIVKPGDIGAIAENIIKLAENSALRQAMGRNNLALAREKYDMPVVAAKIKAVYEALSAGRGKPDTAGRYNAEEK